jgi:hypothetical protein
VSELSPIVIQLFKGPIYREAHELLWEPLLKRRAQVADYAAVLGLRVEVDETNGFAYLASLADVDGTPPLPRLIARHKLPFHTSLLLALLRKRLAEFDTDSTEGQLVVSTEQLVEMMRLYSRDATNETKIRRDIEININRVKELGFLRQLRSTNDQFEVRPILRAFVDGQFLADLDAELDRYIEQLSQAGNRS